MIRSGRDYGDTGKFDTLVGSTAAQHGITVATKNERHVSPSWNLLGFEIEKWRNDHTTRMLAVLLGNWTRSSLAGRARTLPESEVRHGAGADEAGGRALQ